MNSFSDKKTDNSNISKDEGTFTNWKSYDLWCLGCEFLGTTNLTPTIPQKLSAECQELIKVLFNYSLTKKDDIYEKIFNLNFFKEKIPNSNLINIK